jgi:hypothetical protein
MVTHMKTTVDLPDGLVNEAKGVAAARNTTFRALLVQGLRLVLAQQKKRKRFRLRDASVKGKGLQPGVTPGDWEQLRELIYRGRGA